MGIVVAGFIGKGVPPQSGEKSPYTGYRLTPYSFPEEAGHPAREYSPISFFGAALLQRLRDIGRPAEYWLVMGTAQSMWDALIEAVSEPQQDNIIDSSIFSRLNQSVKKGNVTQELLNEWQDLISTNLSGPKCICRLVGSAVSDSSQQLIWSAFADCVKEEDEIVLDITHGFRHQPIIAAFMVMTLRWLRKVKKVDLYYGAYEHGISESPLVLKLSLCNELLQITEAIATFSQTGNYSLLGQTLRIGDTFEKELAEVVFADEANQPVKKLALGLRQKLSDNEKNFSLIRAAVVPSIRQALDWAAEDSFEKRLNYKSMFAFEHGQYFKAIALLWEAILVAGCHKFNLGDPMNYHVKLAAEDNLYNKLDASNKQVMKSVKHLRNATLHGTKGIDTETIQALKDPKAFRKVYEFGIQLLKSLL